MNQCRLVKQFFGFSRISGVIFVEIMNAAIILSRVAAKYFSQIRFQCYAPSNWIDIFISTKISQLRC